MYPVTSVFSQALRDAHTVAVRVDAYYNNQPLRQDMQIVGGSVTINPGTGVRRTLDVTLADETLWSVLDTVGVELRASRGIRYPNGVLELVPLGVFSLDAMSMQVQAGGGINIRSAPDRWARVQRAAFEKPASSVRGALIRDEIVRLVQQAVPNITVTMKATSDVLVPALVWDRDRAAAITDLATSIAAEVFFDVDGNLVVRDAPLLNRAPVWTVDASASGVLLGGELARDRARTYSVVVASMSAVDGRTPFAPQIVADTDPSSRTYVGGPFGRTPFFYASPNLHNTTQAKAAARTILNRVKAVNAQLNLEAIVHPGLDRGDVITVLTPTGITERHLIDGLTVPLDVGGTQQITTRSSRPDGDVPDEE